MSYVDELYPLRASDKIIVLLFIPFIIWSFLGGHKQYFFGINSDHLATAVAITGSTLVFFGVKKIPRRFVIVCALFFLFMGICTVSVFVSEFFFESLKILFINLAYLYITLALALFFKDRLDLLFSIIISASLISAAIVLVSFLYLGFGNWLRVTIPVYHNGHFLYFPTGYESSSDPNVLSYYLYAGALITFHVKGLRNYWWLAFALIAFSGFLTMSRSGFLGFSVAMILFFPIMIISNFYRKVHINFYVYFLLGSVFFALLLFAFQFIYDFSFIFDVVESRVYSVGSNESRLFRLAYSLNGFVSSDSRGIFFGNGLGYTRFDLDPHLFWFSVLLDSGLMALAFTLFLYVFLFRLAYLSAENKGVKYLIISLFVFFFVVSFLYWQLRFFYFVLFIFIVIYLGSKQKFSSKLR